MTSTDRLRALFEENPDEARRLMVALQDKIVVPHEGGQQAIMEDEHRFQVVCCGRRFGKTVVAAKKALKRTRTHNQMVWWVAPTYKIVKRGYREVLRQLPDGVLTHTPPQDSAFDAGRSVVLKFKNGSRMEFYSAERPEGMLGEGVDLVVIDEAARINASVWHETIRPTLTDRQGSALMISTPKMRNWFYYEWLRGQSDDPKDHNYKSWRYPTAANPYLPPEEIEELAAGMPLIVYQQEILAEFVASAGQVFRWSEEAIVATLAKPRGHVIVGVDLAKSVDFTVFYAANADDGMPCGYERYNDVSWPMQRNKLKSFVHRLQKQGASHVTLVMDATPGSVGDPFVEDMEADGYDVVPISFKKLKQQMVMLLSKDLEDGFVRLYDAEVHEFENFAYEVTDSGNITYGAPEGQHDDVVAAKMLQHWGLVQEGAPNITAVSSAPDEDPQEDALDKDGYAAPDDWSDLVDPDYAEDTGRPEVSIVSADDPRAIMLRDDAWHSYG